MTTWKATVEAGKGLASVEMETSTSEDWSDFGYIPVSGTLNLRCKLPLRQAMRKTTPAVWNGPEDMSPSAHFFYPITINGFPCHARTHEYTIEVVAPVRLRDHLSLSDGDIVSVRLRVEKKS